VPKKVFISYRREDTGPAAGRVYDRLSRILRKTNVFFDVSTIGGGANFEKTIVDAIARSDAVLIFIGEKWLQPVQPTGVARIWEANDYVRTELRAALARPILVLPVLVGGTQMPKPEQLPQDIKTIATKNALPLRHESFDGDTEQIVAALLGVPAKERPWEDKGTLWSKITYAMAGAVAACTFMLIVALIHFWILARPLSASLSEPVTMLLLFFTLISGIAIGLMYEARKRFLR
jgi:hypothetical protein